MMLKEIVEIWPRESAECKVIDRVDLNTARKKSSIQGSNLVSQALESGQGLFSALQQHRAFHDVALAVSPHSAERRLVTFMHIGNIAAEDWRAVPLGNQYRAHLSHALEQPQ